MNPALARKLLEECAVLVIAGIPARTEFGIDLCSYKIGSNFRGVKMIPIGPHYVWCAAQGEYGDSAPRVGFVHFFQGGEIVVREWDSENEELRERQINDPDLEKRRIRENLLELDRYLAPYDYQSTGEWKKLTDAVNKAAVERCRPALSKIRSNVELQSCPDSERPRGSKDGRCPQIHELISDESDLLPDLKPIEGTAPRFSALPTRVPKDAQPAEVSRHCMDCIEAVDALLSSFENSSSNALIEEIQLSFVFFLVGHSFESLAHWRKILYLLAHSETAIVKYKLLYMKYSEVLAHQLPQLPLELMEPTQHNKVYADIRSLLVNLHLSGLNHSAERLSKNLLRSMKWEFTGLLDDDPEEMPVVVESV